MEVKIRKIEKYFLNNNKAKDLIPNIEKMDGENLREIVFFLNL